MKELSIEEKAKAYDEALKRARVWKDKSGMPADKQGILDDIFPELKESEDEKIRTAIIHFISHTPTVPKGIIGKETMLAWLEKQGEKLPVGFYYVNSEGEKFYSDTFKYGNVTLHVEKQGEPIIEMKSPEESLGISSKEYNDIVNDCLYDEQKPADKIEPKFKVGDYVVGKYISGYISEVRDDCYLLDYQGFSIDKQDNYHLWTIQDAKDGDVLAINWHEGDNSWEKIIIFKKYYNKGVEGLINAPCVEGYGNTFKNGKLVWNEKVPYYSKTWTANLHPATKEQRELLFQKMREAGYEWNAEKKELKKSNSYCQEHCKGFQETGKCFADGDCKAKIEAEQKTAIWDGEDNAYKLFAISAVEDYYDGKNPLRKDIIDWLNSLKQRMGG